MNSMIRLLIDETYLSKRCTLQAKRPHMRNLFEFTLHLGAAGKKLSFHVYVIRHIHISSLAYWHIAIVALKQFIPEFRSHITRANIRRILFASMLIISIRCNEHQNKQFHGIDASDIERLFSYCPSLVPPIHTPFLTLSSYFE